MFCWKREEDPIKKSLREYAKRTPFTYDQLLSLLRRFRKLDFDGSNSLSLEELCEIDELKANPFARRILEVFSTNGSGQLNLEKFVQMMGVFNARAPIDHKIVWSFALWDFDGDDLLGKNDIATGIKLMTQQGARERLTTEQIKRIVQQVMTEVDPYCEGLSFLDYQSIVLRMPDFLENFKISTV